MIEVDWPLAKACQDASFLDTCLPIQEAPSRLECQALDQSRHCRTPLEWSDMKALLTLNARERRREVGLAVHGLEMA